MTFLLTWVEAIILIFVEIQLDIYETQFLEQNYTLVLGPLYHIQQLIG